MVVSLIVFLLKWGDATHLSTKQIFGFMTISTITSNIFNSSLGLFYGILTDLFLPNWILSVQYCQFIYFGMIFIYDVYKFCVYLLFTFRLSVVFHTSYLQYTESAIHFMRLGMAISAFSLSII